MADEVDLNAAKWLEQSAAVNGDGKQEDETGERLEDEANFHAQNLLRLRVISFIQRKKPLISKKYNRSSNPRTPRVNSS